MGLLRIPKKCEEGKDGKILLNFAKSVRRRCEEGAKEVRRGCEEDAKDVRRGCEGGAKGMRRSERRRKRLGDDNTFFATSFTSPFAILASPIATPVAFPSLALIS